MRMTVRPSLWKLFARRGEADVVASCISSPATLLEFGCGAGRITRELTGRGYAVTAVDFSPCADIGSLQLKRRFDGVLLTSYLINVPDDRRRADYLATCALHCSRSGRVLIERHASMGSSPLGY
jgi:SAM-dependent methyltransferase